jgi:hypothetical protein
MSEEIKDMLQALIEGQQKLSAELQGFRKETYERFNRMEEEVKAIRQEMATKEDVDEIREDFRVLTGMFGEHQHEIRKLKKKVRENI